SANVTAIGLAATVKYFMARAKKAVDEGLHKGPAEQVTLRVKFARFRRGGDGSITLKGLNIEGPAPAVISALHTLLDPKNEVIPSKQVELEAPSSIANSPDAE